MVIISQERLTLDAEKGWHNINDQTQHFCWPYKLDPYPGRVWTSDAKTIWGFLKTGDAPEFLWF